MIETPDNRVFTDQQIKAAIPMNAAAKRNDKLRKQGKPVPTPPMFRR